MSHGMNECVGMVLRCTAWAAGLRGAAWGCVGLRGAAWCCVVLRGAAWGCVGLRGAAWHAWPEWHARCCVVLRGRCEGDCRRRRSIP